MLTYYYLCIFPVTFSQDSCLYFIRKRWWCVVCFVVCYYCFIFYQNNNTKGIKIKRHLSFGTSLLVTFKVFKSKKCLFLKKKKKCRLH